MAQSRSLPANFPQTLGVPMLKSEAQRQISMLRQEFVTELLGVLSLAREPGLRAKLLKLVEHNLRAGIAAAERTESLWPNANDARAFLENQVETKPTTVRKQVSVFEQLDKSHTRALGLLKDSFDHTRVILDRLQPAPLPEAVSTAVPAPVQKKAAST